jgi:antitoxin component of MazEF toxin-antitoxin module
VADQYDPNSPPPRPNGFTPKMAEFAEMIRLILDKHAGGFSTPIPVRMIDENTDQEVEIQVTPGQLIQNLTVALCGLEAQLAEMAANQEAEEEDDEEPYVRKKRRRR